MQAGAQVAAVLVGAGALGAGLVLAGAGATKLRHRRLLPGVVANYRLLPDALVAPFALVLPWAELALGLALLAAPFVARVAQGAGLAGAGLLLLFAAAMAVNLRRGRSHIDCGCGHPQLRQPLSWLLVARNLLLALPLAALALGAGATLSGVDAATALAGLAVCLVYHLFNTLAALSASPLAATLLPVRR
jgi:hypothetical protein